MIDTSRPRTRRVSGLAASAAALGLAATLGLTAPATAQKAPNPVQAPPGAAQSADAARTVDVMTRNLYLGADLLPVVGALTTNNPTVIAKAATATWHDVQATRPEERMAAIADEIVAAKPAAVGLQEVTRWTTYDTTFAPTVAYDFLDLLLDALAERGVTYREVEGATAENFSSPPIPLLPDSGAAAVSMQDRDVILVRDGVKTANARHGTFTHKITVPLEVKRGWGSVDLRTRLATFRFVNSHLEAFSFTSSGITAEQLRVLQVGELLDAQAALAAEAGDLPTVYVGDYNSKAPAGAAYQALVAGVGSDAWTTTNPGAPGQTCCFDADVTDPTATLDSRIDLVVVDEQVRPTRSTVVGEETGELTPSGLWPSDHAGVVTRLVVGGER